MNRGKQHPAHFKLQSYLQKNHESIKRNNSVVTAHVWKKLRIKKEVKNEFSIIWQNKKKEWKWFEIF